jgi:hypothetical protein
MQANAPNEGLTPSRLTVADYNARMNDRMNTSGLVDNCATGSMLVAASVQGACAHTVSSHCCGHPCLGDPPHGDLSNFDNKLTTYVKLDKIHVHKFQERNFLRQTKTMRDAN